MDIESVKKVASLIYCKEITSVHIDDTQSIAKWCFDYEVSEYMSFEESVADFCYLCKKYALERGYSLLSEQGKKASSCGIYKNDNLSFELNGSISKYEYEAIVYATEIAADYEIYKED